FGGWRTDGLERLARRLALGELCAAKLFDEAANLGGVGRFLRDLLRNGLGGWAWQSKDNTCHQNDSDGESAKETHEQASRECTAGALPEGKTQRGRATCAGYPRDGRKKAVGSLPLTPDFFPCGSAGRVVVRVFALQDYLL